MMEKEGWAGNKQHTDLGRPSSCLQCPSSKLNQRLCSSTEPSWGGALTKELWGGGGGKEGCRSVCFRSSNKFCQLQSCVAHVQARCRVIAPPAVESAFQPHLVKKADELLEAVQPSGTGAKRQVDRADLPQGKASTKCKGFPGYTLADELIHSQG